MATATNKGASSAPEMDELAQFKGTNIQAVKEDVETGGKRGRRSGRFFDLAEGDTTVRFLPGDGEEPFFYETGYHWLNGETVYCRKFLDKNAICPICKHASHVWKQSTEEKDSEIKEKLEIQAKSLFAKEQYFYNAVVRDKEGDKVVVLKTGKSVKAEVVKLIFNEEYGDVTHPITGSDIVITRSGKKEATRYATTPKRKQSLLAGSLDDKKSAAGLIKAILDQRKDISTLIEYPTEELAAQKIQAYKDGFKESAEAPASSESETEERTFDPQLAEIDQAIEKASAARK